MMEKKTKKLQLRKETIAVLNGERMSHVVGGVEKRCFITEAYYAISEAFMYNNELCICQGEYIECTPNPGGTIVFTLVDCPTQFTCPSKGEDCTLA